MGPTPLHVNPIFEIGPIELRFSEWLVFEGIRVDESGRQHFLDAIVAYERAMLNVIDYLSRFGTRKNRGEIYPSKSPFYDLQNFVNNLSANGGYQVCLLLSCCPCEGKISRIVDSPNVVATLAISSSIFDQDIRPKTKQGAYWTLTFEEP
ncbi:unnamed protein product [Fraxinus pennsylvanica]|uniref:Uncharacterized protein n=1 Tax=Fraxinus pennsylvanica TaxID=56036 RepID=A0AAD1Z194_9LAMI|nr:unnamed protein product [Fraxinus pennsylvanica]